MADTATTETAPTTGGAVDDAAAGVEHIMEQAEPVVEEAVTAVGADAAEFRAAAADALSAVSTGAETIDSLEACVKHLGNVVASLPLDIISAHVPVLAQIQEFMAGLEAKAAKKK